MLDFYMMKGIAPKAYKKEIAQKAISFVSYTIVFSLFIHWVFGKSVHKIFIISHFNM